MIITLNKAGRVGWLHAALLIFFAALFCLLQLTVSQSHASDGITLFEQFIAEHPKVDMQFQQTTVNEDGSELPAINGRLWFEIPDLFRLQYDNPAMPEIISDGSTIWFYEPDIQQAVSHPITDAEQFGLLAIFSGGGLDALKQSHILSTGQDKNWRWLIAETKNESQNIRKIRLGWNTEANRLQRIFVHDAFGGQVRIEVSDISEPSVNSEHYVFTPPAGVDLIRLEEDQQQ